MSDLDDDVGVQLMQKSRRIVHGVLAPADAPPPPTDDKPRPVDIGPWGFDIEGMDQKLQPGDNWVDYTSGEWLKKTNIPDDQSSWTAFSSLQELTEFQIRDLLEQGATANSITGTLYAAYMDEATIEARGLEPVLPFLEKIKQLATASDFATFCGETLFGFGSSPFGFGVGADAKDPDMNVAQLSQDGLGLPSRDYYLEETFSKQKKAYADYIVLMLGKIGWPEPEAAGAEVLAFEESVAKVSWSVEARRDPEKTYNKMTIADLTVKAPGFDWAAYMESAGRVPGNAPLVVSEWNETAKDGIIGIAAIIGSTDLTTLRAWSAFHFISGAASYLSKEYVDAAFGFSKALSGQETQKLRWKRGVGNANRFLPDAVGKDYVEKYFPASSKKTMDELTSLLKEAFAARIKNVAWMTNATKEAAQKKLASFTFEIGYPKKFKDYSEMSMDKTDLFGNLEKALAFSARWDLSQLGKQVDKAYWGMPPQTVNAFFEPDRNRCVFLAAILQPPFFYAEGDMAVNFGSIGAVIGHEMTHGFDDKGRLYDAEGKLNDWWTPADTAEFTKRADQYGEQFAKFTSGLPEGMHIRPQLTMGENIADLGGLTIAYEAWQMWQKKNSYTPQPPMLEEYGSGGSQSEGDRRFFAGWAQVWRSKYRPSALINSLTTDPHSPGPARATIPVQNLGAWYAAYGVKPGEGLFLDAAERVVIW